MSPDGSNSMTLRPGLSSQIFPLVAVLAVGAFAGLLVRHGFLDGVAPIVVVFWILMGVAGLLTFGALARTTLGQRVILRDDGIEIVVPGGENSTLRWPELAGVRNASVGGLELVPRESTRRPVLIPGFAQEAVRRRLPPGLEAVSAARVEGNGWLALILVLDLLIVLLYNFSKGFGIPAAFPLFLAALLPLTIAIAAGSNGEFRILPQEGDRERRESFLVGLSGVPVAGWALAHHHPVGGAAPWGAAIVGGAILVLLVRAVQPGTWRRSLPWLYLPGLAAWPVGLVLALNGVLDSAPPELHRTAIVEKVAPDWGGNVRVLALAPWGPFREPLRTRVSRELHAAVEPGGTAELSLHRGALGIPWYAVEGVRGP